MNYRADIWRYPPNTTDNMAPLSPPELITANKGYYGNETGGLAGALPARLNDFSLFSAAAAASFINIKT